MHSRLPALHRSFTSDAILIMDIKLFTCLCLVVCGDVSSQDKSSEAYILEHEFRPSSSSENGQQSYHFRFKTSNGIERQENGFQSGIKGLVVRGSYTYTSPNGQEHIVSYIADKLGFRTVTKFDNYNPAIVTYQTQPQEQDEDEEEEEIENEEEAPRIASNVLGSLSG